MSGTGIYLGNIDYWLHSKGGFFPYGVKGMFSGASTLIFAYVGYEVVASATEEAVNPQRCVEEVSALIFAVNETVSENSFTVARSSPKSNGFVFFA